MRTESPQAVKARLLAAQGVAKAEIARRLGVGESTVRLWVKHYRPQANVAHILDAEEVVTLRRQGMTFEEIAKRLEKPPSSVRSLYYRATGEVE